MSTVVPISELFVVATTQNTRRHQWRISNRRREDLACRVDEAIQRQVGRKTTPTRSG